MLEIFSKFITSGLGSVVATLVSVISLCGTAMAVFSQWRSIQGDMRILSVDDKTKLVAFWTSWFDAYSKLGDPGDQGTAVADLKSYVRERLDELRPTAKADLPEKSPLRTQWAERLLLLDRPRRPGLLPWLTRAPFHLLVAIFLITQTVMIWDLVGRFSFLKTTAYVTLTALSILLITLVRFAYSGRDFVAAPVNKAG
jgi:hypothetical protein